MQFCERLTQARKERGYTQLQIAEAIGVAKSTYAGYEKGMREPDLFKLKKIISFLHVDSSWLLGLDDEPGITAEEWQLLYKYRALDDRGRSNVRAVLDNEYNLAHPQDSVLSGPA